MDRITVSQLYEIEKKGGRKNKYGAKKTEYNGHMFDSKHEARVAEDIDFMMKDKGDSNPIVAVEYHPPKYDMIVNGIKITHYTADFKVTRKDGSVEIWDAKSDPTRKKSDYVMRKKLLKALHGIDIIEK